jgi:hypothetical protein
VGRKIDWDGDRRHRLTRTAEQTGKRVKEWGKAYVQRMSGAPRTLTAKERRGIDGARRQARQRELVRYAAEMTRRYGAPPECHLAPRDCARLSRSIRVAGNVPPTWITLASQAYEAATARP